jgi:hypothetical protein
VADALDARIFGKDFAGLKTRFSTRMDSMFWLMGSLVLEISGKNYQSDSRCSM